MTMANAAARVWSPIHSSLGGVDRVESVHAIFGLVLPEFRPAASGSGVRKGQLRVSGTSNQSRQERASLNGRIFFGGMVFEVVGGIVMIFLLSWPTNVIVVVPAALILAAYNTMFWLTLKKQAADESRRNTSELP